MVDVGLPSTRRDDLVLMFARGAIFQREANGNLSFIPGRVPCSNSLSVLLDRQSHSVLTSA